VVLSVFQILPEQKPGHLLSGKFPSLRKYFRINSLWNTLIQRAVELCKRSLCCAVRWRHLSRKWRSGEDLLGSLTTMLAEIALREILLLEEIQG
jgi:hypothetical protein